MTANQIYPLVGLSCLSWILIIIKIIVCLVLYLHDLEKWIWKVSLVLNTFLDIYISYYTWVGQDPFVCYNVYIPYIANAYVIERAGFCSYIMKFAILQEKCRWRKWLRDVKNIHKNTFIIYVLCDLRNYIYWTIWIYFH